MPLLSNYYCNSQIVTKIGQHIVKKMPDRTQAPHISKIEKIDFPQPVRYTLSNGTPLWVLDTGVQDIIKLDMFFNAGRPYETKKLVARATSKLLLEGTKKHSAHQIAEILDFHGTTLASPVDLDTSSLILYSLGKHFPKMLDMVCEILTEPSFNEEELNLFKQNTIQKLKFNNSKCDIRAYRQVTESIFGPDHPYGYNSSPEMINDLKRADLVNHFAKLYNADNCTLMASGKVTPEHIHLIDQKFSAVLGHGEKAQPNLDLVIQKPRRIDDYVPEAVQTSIRIGRRLVNRSHEDYNGLYILNTILGGYFGSRLMMNIREEKGYTYNIFSSLDTMLYDGYFYVGTEVDNKYAEKTIQEIYSEMERLKVDLVDDIELEMVKNYLMGNLLTMIDGPMNSSEVVKAFLINKLPFGSFNHLIYKIQTIEAEELRTLAVKYLNRERMWEVVSGGVNN